MPRLVVIAIALVMLGAACKDSSDVRTLEILIEEGGCTPVTFDVDPGRHARLSIENEAEVVYTIRDGDDLLEEITVEPDESAEAFFSVPENDGTYVLLCEAEGVASSEIELRAGTGVSGGSSGDATPAEGASGTPQTGSGGTLAVSLLDYEISPSSETIPDGRYNIIATNVTDASTHELNLLQLQPDGSFVNVAQIQAIPPQQGGAVLAALEPGTYRLACQIVPGEFGSTVDHYQQGMWFDIVVVPPEQ